MQMPQVNSSSIDTEISIMFLSKFGRKCLWAVLMMISSGVVHGALDLENTDLARWLNQQGGPTLTRMLADSPRFAGETVRLVAMVDGRVSQQQTSELTQAVLNRLSQAVLAQSNARLQWHSAKQFSGCVPTPATPYLIGVELRAQGSRHRLTIRAVDVAEGVWVSGLDLEWTGRLSRAETRAATQKSLVVIGDAPLSITSHAEIAQRLVEGFKCTWPRGLDGKLYVQASPGGEMVAILAEVKRQLSVTSLVALTPVQSKASWILTLQLLDQPNPAAVDVTELAMMLRPAQVEDQTQQVASIAVSGARYKAPRRAVAKAPETPRPAPVISHPVIASHPDLLGDIKVLHASRDGVCAKSPRPALDCVEVSVELRSHAYLFVFTAEDQTVGPLSCYQKLKMVKPGDRRYRMRVAIPDPQSVDRETGFYVVAVSNERVAHKLNRLFHDAPGGCVTDRQLVSNAQWLDQLAGLLRTHTGDISWRATHFVRSGSSVAQI
jgi:hypothetical protein